MIETKTILLGTVLKPVDDTRMYEKLGKSLSKIEGYHVSIFGLKSSQNIKDSEIEFYPQSTFQRLSFSRLKMRLKFYKTCLKVKPDIIIVNTHELLGVMLLFRIIFGSKAIYDIQENYSLNILYGNSFSRLLRPFIATWVRLKERLFSPFIHYFFLAERAYEKELPFIGKRYTILENKFVFPEGFKANTSHRHLPENRYKIIYTGTIAETYGVFEAVDFFNLFQEKYPGSTLTIIGYCPKKQTLKRLKSAISTNPNIILKGGDELVPHVEILDCIQYNDLAIVPYQLNRSIVDCFPTKVWEYMSLGIPFIIKRDLPWVPYCKEFDACIDIDFKSPDWEELNKILRNNSFYSNTSISPFLWLEQENALFKAFSNII